MKNVYCSKMTNLSTLHMGCIVQMWRKAVNHNKALL